MSKKEKAQAKIRKWKKALKKGHEIAKMTGVNEPVISRIYNGLDVADKHLDAILEVK